MSWDVELVVEVDGHEVQIPDTWLNYTHNTNAMVREAGYSQWPYEVDGKKANEVALKLALVIEKLRSDPEKYRAMNPKNGWGDYDSLIAALEKVAMTCLKYPSASFRMSA